MSEEKTQSQKTIDLSDLGGRLIFAPPPSNPAGKPARIDVSDLYGDKGGLVLEAPTPEKPEAESVESTDEGKL